MPIYRIKVGLRCVTRALDAPDRESAKQEFRSLYPKLPFKGCQLQVLGGMNGEPDMRNESHWASAGDVA